MLKKNKAKNSDGVEYGKSHMVVIYDTIAKQAGNIVMLPTLALVTRFVRGNIKAFSAEFEVHYLGVFNHETMQMELNKEPTILLTGSQITDLIKKENENV